MGIPILSQAYILVRQLMQGCAWFATNRRYKIVLPKFWKELSLFWHQTNCMLNLLSLRPCFGLAKIALAIKQIHSTERTY
jgi:hypothetical protein